MFLFSCSNENQVYQCSGKKGTEVYYVVPFAYDNRYLYMDSENDVRFKQRFKRYNLNKKKCPMCIPNRFCEHNKRRDKCKICTPNLFCFHNKRKSDCFICNPNSFCEHNRRKRTCKICISIFNIKDYLI